MLSVARLRVKGAITRRFCNVSGPNVVFEYSSDMLCSPGRCADPACGGEVGTIIG
jgi:hypothetical protein